MGGLCKDYKAQKIGDREFFFGVVSSPFGSQQMSMPNIGFLDKYNKAVSYLNNNKLIYFAALLILVILLYLLIMDLKVFLVALSGIFFSIGVLIMLPYFIILAYDKFAGIDTTPILGGIMGAGNIFDAKAIASVINLFFFKKYTNQRF